MGIVLSSPRPVIRQFAHGQFFLHIVILTIMEVELVKYIVQLYRWLGEQFNGS